ncbi:MAG TPA: condensation domain-containing protein, partial [Blastocatellia bacterium]
RVAGIAGRLDINALRDSIREIIRRHEILRTTFDSEDLEPIQVIHMRFDFALPVVDLRSISEAQRRAEAQRALKEEFKRPFDLKAGPLFRITLIRLFDEDHIFVMVRHHIIFDEWSDSVFLKELQALYGAFFKGEASPLPELPTQYADFANWQRQWLSGEGLKAQLSYWRAKLSDAPPLLELPTDRPRPLVKTFRGSKQSIALTPSLSEDLRALAQQEGATLFMIMLSAYQILLRRYTGQEDIVVGSPIANRNRRELEGLIGFFVNTLALRTDVSGDPTFGELLARVRDTCLEAYSHRDLPFQKLVQELQPQRSPGYQPLLQVVFALQRDLTREFKLVGEVMLRAVPAERDDAMAELEMVVLEADQGLSVSVEYNTDLFDRPTIDRLLAHTRTLLQGIVANPKMRVSELPLLDASERKQILEHWNDTRKELHQEMCVYQLFEAQAVETPHAVAAIFDNDELTYDELNRRSNRLARFLVESGVGPEDLIALLAERDLDYLTALIAVHKAGGAFLALDPRDPASRVAQVLGYSGARLVLAGENYLSLLLEASSGITAGRAPQILSITQTLKQPGQEDNLPARCGMNNLAYVMFTSGSTGTPKGAMIEHRGMLNHAHAKIRDLRLTDQDTLAQTSPQSFDIMVWQFLAPLLVGGRVHIFRDEIAFNPILLLDNLELEGITVLQLVPALLKAMVQEAAERGDSRPRLSALRWVVPTGEALPVETCREWLRLYPSIPMLNNCGATECSDDYCHHSIFEAASIDDSPPIMPIGRPIMNMKTYVLDRALRPVPAGVLGELYASGSGLGRGYLRDPARTAETFIP